MEETTEIRIALESLYEAFASYPLRDDTNPCLCCHSSEDEKRVRSRPLRQLKPDDLKQYANDALSVWGTEMDFKHFLPRIFELEVTHGEEFLDPEVVFKKLHYSEWRYWPVAEQKSVEHFFHAVWKWILSAQPHEYYGWQIEGWLCGIAQAAADLSPYLNTWASMDTENPRLNLALFIAETDFADPNCRPSAYWMERPELFTEVGTWVRGGVVKEKMKAITAEYPEYGFVERAYVSLP